MINRENYISSVYRTCNMNLNQILLIIYCSSRFACTFFVNPEVQIAFFSNLDMLKIDILPVVLHSVNSFPEITVLLTDFNCIL